MSTTHAATPMPAPSTGPGAGRVLAVAAGAVVALVALALLIAGLGLLWLYAEHRDADGFYTSPAERLSTPTHALTAERLEIGDVGRGPSGWTVDDWAGRVRVRAAPVGGRPVFVGIGPAARVDAYLEGVAHDQVADVGDGVDYRRADGRRPPARPREQGFWVASAAGAGAQAVDWEVGEGNWSVVVMNADGSRGVAAEVRVAAQAGFVPWVGGGLLAAGLLGLGLAGLLLWLGLRTAPDADGGDGHAPPATAATASAAPAAAGAAADPLPGAAATSGEAYPVQLDGRLDEPLSRWLWIVKPILLIPHAIVLAFLWLAFVVLTVIAFFAILFTGRYPRAMFDFNVGVLRWTWRVAFYGTGALATDRYPPFTLGRVDYPADLEIPYPAQLSRGLVLVKWWLLAIPHYVVVAVFLGWWSTDAAAGDAGFQPPGLLAVLVVIAALWLLVTRRYPRDVFDLVVGICRWTVRVVAYAALMRDDYPPFRLGR
jgi:hypothetical protein